MNRFNNQRLPVQNNREEEILTALNVDFQQKEEEIAPTVVIARQWKQIQKNFQVLLSPGEKQYRDLPKRVRLMLVSFLIPLIFFTLKGLVFEQTQSLFLWGGVSFLLSILAYIGTIWGLKAQVRKESYYSVLPLGAVYTFTTALFLSVVFTGEINRVYLWILFVLAIAAFMITLYIHLLAINILNVNLFYSIPLSRLGESITYMYSVVAIFLLSITFNLVSVSLLLTYNWLYLGLLCALYLLVVAILSVSLLLYFLPLNRDILPVSMGLVFLLCAVNLVLSLVSSIVWVGAAGVSVFAYVMYGYLIHKQQNTMKTTVHYEFIALMAALLLLLLFI